MLIEKIKNKINNNKFIINIIINILFIYLKIDRHIIKRNTEKSILFLANFDKYGGTRTYAENLLEVLIKNNYKIYFVKNEKNIITGGYNLLENKKIIYYKYNYSFNNLINIFISLININKIIKENNIYTTIISEGDCGYYIPCILLNTKNILIEHTIPEKLDYYRKITLSKIQNNTRIICVSNFQKKETETNWGQCVRSHCSVIYNSGSFNSSFLFKNNSNKNIKKIITVAHFISYKNPDMWFSIANKLTEKYTELEFIWIGDGNELLKYKNNLTGKKAIKFLGYCNHEQIKEQYENAFLYLALSKIESLGIAVIDALHAGIPAIVLNTGGLPEVIDSEKCGFVVKSENETIEKIEILLNNEELYKNMSNNAIERYNILFSNTIWENKIISILNNQIINTPPPPLNNL